MDEIVQGVLRALSPEDIEGDKALKLDKDDVAVPISKSNFNKLPEKTNDKTVAFVDGGNSEILGAASFSLQYLRVGSVTYPGKKKQKEEFYLLITFEKGKFTIKTFPEGKLPDLTFDSLDSRIRTGNERVLAERIGGVCRRLAELRLASKLDADFVVLDGDLHSRTSQEEELIESLGKNVAALSKTTNLITEQGRVFSAAIASLGEGSWHYGPVFSNRSVFFAKLHPRSEYVFRIDMKEDSKKEELLGILAAHSKDPVFLGYPYGLIEVDKYARVSNREVEILRTKLMAKFGKDWKQVKTYLRTGDAHRILDSVG